MTTILARSVLEPDRLRQASVRRQRGERRRAGAFSPAATELDERQAVADQGRDGAASRRPRRAGRRARRSGCRARTGGTSAAARSVSVGWPSIGDHIGFQPVEAQAHDAGIAGIGEAKPDAAFPGGASIRWGTALPLTVSQLPSRPAGPSPPALEGRERAVVVQPPIVDQERDVAVDRRRVRLLDDQEAGEAALRRLGAAARDAGPEQEGAGIGRREAVIEPVARARPAPASGRRRRPWRSGRARRASAGTAARRVVPEAQPQLSPCSIRRTGPGLTVEASRHPRPCPGASARSFNWRGAPRAKTRSRQPGRAWRDRARLARGARRERSRSRP